MRMRVRLLRASAARGSGVVSEQRQTTLFALLACAASASVWTAALPVISLPTGRGNYESTSSTCVVDRGTSVSCTKADYYLPVEIVLACNFDRAVSLPNLLTIAKLSALDCLRTSCSYSSCALG